MGSPLAQSRVWQFPCLSSIGDVWTVSSKKRSVAFSWSRFSNRACRCSKPEDAEETSQKNNANFGRRETLLSMVAGVSGTSASHLLEDVVDDKTQQEGAPQALAAGNVGPLAAAGEGATNSGITSEYLRPKDPSPTLPVAPTSSRNLSGSTPSQVYVSLHGPDHMQVCWITTDAGASIVDYGTSAGNYTGTATGSSSSYKYGSYTSGNIHYVIIGPLDDETTYFYRCGGVDPEFSFKTPPPSGPEVPIKFAVVGDLGQTSNTKSTLDHIASTSYDVLILPGDLSYADGDQPRWDSFGHLVSPLASKRPWMVTQGNHEIEGGIGIEEFRAYFARWKMPHELSGSDSNLFYSFDAAGVHFLMLGSYADYSHSSDQYKWLKKDLAKVDRSKTPWLIGVIHAPWYNSNLAHYGEGNGMLNAMEDILYEAKVDIMFAGHVHAYERAVRTYKGKPNKHGITYINIGDGGNREGLAHLYLQQPIWSAFREASYGHGELVIHGSKTAEWSWHRNQDDEAVVADKVTITSLSSVALAKT